MRIHHLNCGTMRSFGGRLTEAGAKGIGPTRWVYHCLLVETEQGLVLVDTGFGEQDARDGDHRLGAVFTALTRPDLDVRETAAAQVDRLGYDVDDVRHVVLTHLDLDHAGGIGDFRRAEVHVHAAEHAAAMSPNRAEGARYRRHHWEHGPARVTHGEAGKRWFDFESVRSLPGLPPEILLVPLHGHSRGHTGVAVRKGDGWLLHAGDAFFSHHRIDGSKARTSPLARAFENVVRYRGTDRRHNQQRLRKLVRDRGDLVDVVCSHDAAQFDHRARSVP